MVSKKYGGKQCSNLAYPLKVQNNAGSEKNMNVHYYIDQLSLFSICSVSSVKYFKGLKPNLE